MWMVSVRAFRNCDGGHGSFGRNGPTLSSGFLSPCLSEFHSAVRRMVSAMEFPLRVISGSSGWGLPRLALKRGFAAEPTRPWHPSGVRFGGGG
jgi:hypothetical protein